MRRSLSVVVGLCALLGMGLAPGAAQAQSTPFPAPQWWREVVHRPGLPSQIPDPEHLRDYLADGKLRLTLEQAIQLALSNNTNVLIDQLTYQNSAYNILFALSPFDPTIQSNFSANHAGPSFSSTQTTQLTPGSLTQVLSTNYNQLFETGTNIGVGLSTARSSFGGFPANYFSALNFSASQPLLRNRGLFPNRAPIVIARRNLHQSRMNFEAQVSSIIQNVVSQYWSVVLARENLDVLRKSVAQAQASYDHDKRALELGALGPYDIFQSESQLASRKVLATQAEYTLREQEDSLRVLIGADLDPRVSALDMDLVEASDPGKDLVTLDVGQVLQLARAKRPEYSAEQDQLAVDDLNIRLAHNQMQPSFNLSANYSGQTLPTGGVSTPLGPSLSQAFQLNAPSYGFGLSLNLPVRNRAAEGQLGTTEVNKRRDLYSKRQLEQSIQLEARNAINNLEVAKLSLAQAFIARDLAQKNLEGEQKKYDLGLDSIFVLLQTQLQLTSAEQAVIQAQVSYQLALVGVDHATGEILEHHHVEIKDPKL
ncbi:MAG TPA: TolC family protein [Candidatus Acidoferrales bacterium]|nr:TolC family protein [Candidatus Acidoferrales bacterium]